MIRILDGLGIKCINILQPVCDIASPNHSEITSSLIPYYGVPDFSIYNYYTKLIPYIQQIGAAKYDIDFHILEPRNKPYEFIEAAHLSPEGEIQFANTLFDKFNHLFTR